MSSRLKNKVAIITGAAKGQGEFEARLFASEGATVVLCDIDVETCGKTAEEISSSGGSAVSMTLDVTSEPNWIGVIEQTVEFFGKLDILVNNAGRGDSMPFVDVDREYFNAYVGLNLWAPLRLWQHAYEYLAKSSDPSVVMIGSVDAERPSPGSVVYGATKGALSAATVALSKEWMAAGIRVNQVNPGLVDTQLTSQIVRSLKESGESINIAGRVGSPDEIAGLVHYLVAPVGRFANGTSFRIDGGALALGPFDRWQQ